MKAIKKQDLFPNEQSYLAEYSDDSPDEYQNTLDILLPDEFDNLYTSNSQNTSVTDEFRILLPKNGQYWDNGHEDVVYKEGKFYV